MKRKLLILGALALASLFSLDVARAADPVNRRQKPIQDEVEETFSRSWNGFYVGGALGYGYATLDALPAPAAIGVQDWLFNLQVGADAQIAKHWVVGVFADYEFAKSQDWDQGWWTLGARGGYLMTPNMLLYGLGGYTQAWKHSEVDAMMAGGGLEYRLGAGWSTKLEYRHHFIDLGGFTDLSGNSVRVGVNYKFGGN